jgi:hypothetical protein
MEFQFNNLHFESFPDDIFRLHCGPDIHNTKKASGLILWMESRKTKAQWSVEVMDDVSKYGPIGIPHQVLFRSLRQALELREGADLESDCATVSSGVGAQVSVTCNIDDCSKAMTLELSMFIAEGWSNVYKFVLEWKEVSKAEVIVAKLRDAEEEIAHLKEELKKKEDKLVMNTRPIIQIRGGSGPNLIWGGSEVIIGDKSVLDEIIVLDKEKCIIQKPGMYRVTCDGDMPLSTYQYSSGWYMNPPSKLQLQQFLPPNKVIMTKQIMGYCSFIVNIEDTAYFTITGQANKTGSNYIHWNSSGCMILEPLFM